MYLVSHQLLHANHLSSVELIRFTDTDMTLRIHTGTNTDTGLEVLANTDIDTHLNIHTDTNTNSCLKILTVTDVVNFYRYYRYQFRYI